MKRIAVILVIILGLGLLLSLPIAGAASDTYYITVINNRLEELKTETLPVEINGVMYVPLTLFNHTSLKTYGIYDRINRIATIYSTEHYIRFEIGGRKTYDDSNRMYDALAIMRNSAVYVPFKTVCDFFGFGSSVVKDSVAPPFIRITTSGSALPDEDFAKAAALKMQSNLNNYLISIAPPPTPTTPLPTPTSTVPGLPNSDVAVYLSFWGIGETTHRILTRLTFSRYRACFFLTADEIRENADLVRRISGQGHSIGLVCSEDIEGDYAEASALLRDVCKTRSILIALDCEYTQELGSIAEDKGLIIWCDSSQTILGRDSEASTGEVSLILDEADDRVDLPFYCSDSTSRILDSVLTYLFQNGYNVKQIVESSPTYLYANGVS